MLEDAEAEETSVALMLQPMVPELEVVHAHADALRLASSRFAGIVVGADLPGETTLALLGKLRSLGVYTPTLVLAEPADTGTWSAAQCHGAYLLPKPCRPESLSAFLYWTRRFRRIAKAQLDVEIHALGQLHRWTAREQEIVRLAASGMTRQELMTALNVEESTIKTTVRRLLRKSRRSTLSEIVSELHRAVFLDRDGTPSEPPMRSA